MAGDDWGVHGRLISAQQHDAASECALVETHSHCIACGRELIAGQIECTEGIGCDD